MNEVLEAVLLFSLLGLVVAVFASSGLLTFIFFKNKKMRNVFASIFVILLVLLLVAFSFESDLSFAEYLENTFLVIGATTIVTSPLIWFIVSLVRFLVAPRDSEERNSRKTSIVCSAIASVVVDGGVLYLIIMLIQGLANM